MKLFTGGMSFALAASIVGAMGCGATPAEETVGKATAALDINSWEDLVNKLGTSGTYVLKQDIVATGKTWTGKSFSGTFDGGDHTISGLSLTNGSFFSTLDNATVRKLRLTGMKMTGGGNKATFGGLAGMATDTTIENCAVEVNIDMTAVAAGGIVGAMYGGSIYRSYAKGSIKGSVANAGGLVGWISMGSSDRTTISESYAQMTIAPNTTNAARAGGIAGYAYAPDIHDVYAVGNVTGRGAVGGIVGEMDCTEGSSDVFLLWKTIYRGEVIDQNRVGGNGWAGPVGTYRECYGLIQQNFYDNQLDKSADRAPFARGYASDQLRLPTSVIGGVYCEPDVVPGRCGDRTWSSPPWTAGSDREHHALMNMPGPNVQPR